jgi:tetratricopeptide (TPR) repeat protein
MLRRTFMFLAAVVLIGAVASLVFFNSQPTTLRLAPNYDITLPLAWLILASTVAGAALVFLVLLARESHWALRQWRLMRALRTSERAAVRRSEARASMLAGRHANARTLLARTARGPEANVDDAVDYGEAFLAEGRAEDGRRHLEEVRRELGDDPRILYALARCCHALGDHASAVAALTGAADALPASAAVQALLRDSLVALGSWQRAEQAQKRLLDLDPEDAVERRRLIDIRMNLSSAAEGSERDAVLRGALALDPTFAPAAVERAALLAEQGKTWRASRVLYKAALGQPAGATLTALERLLEARSPARLLRLYVALRRRHPYDSELALHHAALLLRLGRDGEAEVRLEEMRPVSGRLAARAEELRARILEGRSDSSGAAGALRRALDRSLEE